MNITKLLLLLTILISTHALAQKPALDHSIYDNWKSISTSTISKSGNIIFYSITPQEGDGKIEVKNLKNDLILEVPRGYNAQLTKNELFLVSGIKPLFSETREAKIKKKKPDESPKDSLLIFNIQSNQSTKFANVKSYKTARNGNQYVAFVSDVAIKTPVDTASTKEAKPNTRKEKTQAMLHLLTLATNDTIQFPKVDYYQWSDDEKFLLFTKKDDSKDSTSNTSGLYLYSLETKSLKKISSGKGTYKQLTFDDNINQLSFLADKSPEKTLIKDYKLYYYTKQLDSAIVIANQNSAGIPQTWYVSGDAQINFSSNGDRLFFGLAPIPRVKDTTLFDSDHAKLDIWHWQDDYLQPQQLVNLRRDLSRSYPAVLYLKNQRIVPLGDDKFNRVITTDLANEEWVIITSDNGNRIQSQWDTNIPSNVYLISTLTGKNKLILKNFDGQVYMSPNGRYMLYYDREKAVWASYHIGKSESKILTDGVPVSFANEENDMPALAGSYGLAGWSANGETVYLYDRYDIWSFALDGSKRQLETNGYGRVNKTRLRNLKLDVNENPRSRTTTIESDKPLFLSAFNEMSKENGFYRTTFSKKVKDPTQITMQQKTFRNISANENTKHIIYTKEDYINSPNVYVNNEKFSDEILLSDINPQQANYNWGTAELIQWTTPKGYDAEGILYKPEDFDPNKKYPIIAYFYERLSDGLYTYQAPAPTPSRLNISFFVSNGYLVLAPDIRYEDGHPGQSAEEYINSGMSYLAKNNNWVDSTKMAIQGQSWGGYQVAHLITRTNMYAAAWTGAPVVNMTSAYGGIRWGTGMSRQFQYEKTQSRIGQTPWEARDLYIENSPLFFMDQVQTPVVIMHNDNDGAVPWYQGIEMFTALRRLQKPVWMLNYNGDEHNLIQRQNRKDIQIRQLQFFDHFLKGKPATKWITSGVPAIHKGIDWGLD